MTKSQLFSEVFKWGVLSAIITVAMPEIALAVPDDFKTLSEETIKKQASVIPFLLSSVCYIGGAFLLVSGALSLKKHAEAPGQEPINKGIARIVVGGLITGVPALTSIVQNSLQVGGGSAAEFNKFDVPGMN